MNPRSQIANGCARTWRTRPPVNLTGHEYSCWTLYGLQIELNKFATWFSENWPFRPRLLQEVTSPKSFKLICGPYPIPRPTIVVAKQCYRSSLMQAAFSNTNLKSVHTAAQSTYCNVVELESTGTSHSPVWDVEVWEILWPYQHLHASNDEDIICGPTCVIVGLVMEIRVRNLDRKTVDLVKIGT
jgi:hypothetical protein